MANARSRPTLRLRLARYLGTCANVWMRLQEHYDLEVAQLKLDERIRRKVKILPRENEVVLA